MEDELEDWEYTQYVCTVCGNDISHCLCVELEVFDDLESA